MLSLIKKYEDCWEELSFMARVHYTLILVWMSANIVIVIMFAANIMMNIMMRSIMWWKAGSESGPWW